MLGRAIGLAGHVAASVAGGAAGVLGTLATGALDAVSPVLAPRASGQEALVSAPTTTGSGRGTTRSDPAMPLGRVHVQVRGVHLPAHASAASSVEGRLCAHPAVARAEVNALHGRVMVEFHPEQLTSEQVTTLVRAAESEAGLSAAPHAHAPGHDAGGPNQLLREAVAAGSHAAGLGLAVARQILPLGLPLAEGALSLGGQVTALVDSVPRLRALAEELLSEPVADAAVTVASIGANVLVGRPMGLLVDTLHWYCRARETHARHQAWREWEQRLADRPGAHRSAAHDVSPRPVRLPSGPVEKVAERSAALALGVAALTAAAQAMSLTDATLAAGAAKAAGLGRDVFAARIDQDLCRLGSLVLSPRVLRRLDRVDTTVLDSDVLAGSRMVVDQVVPIAGVPHVAGIADRASVGEHDPPLSELIERAHDLVTSQAAGGDADRGEWRLEPWKRSGEPMPAQAREAAADLARQGCAVLRLHRSDRLVALVGVGEQLDPFARATVAATRRAGTVVIAGAGRRLRRLHSLLRPDDIVAGGGSLAGAVRELQADGHVVALVSTRHSTALAAADLGIGLVTERGRPPWGADVFVDSATGVCRLIDAVAPAKQVSRHSAELAVAGSAMGALFGLLGPAGGAARRAHFGVQTAALIASGLGMWNAAELARVPEPIGEDDTPWHAMSTGAVLASVASAREGLTAEEALRRSPGGQRHDTAGLNLAQASAQELATPLTPALAFGASLSAATGSLLDAALILVVLGLNAVIGGTQQLSAQRSLRALRHHSDALVLVRRKHAAPVRVRSDRLVVGEVICLQAGQSVPADCRILDSHDLEVDESPLTGESMPVAKSARATSAHHVAERRSMLYDGTTVAAGRADAVVVAVGEHTEAGRAMRLREAAPPTGVEKRLRTLTGRVLPASAGAGVLLVAVDLLRRRPLGQTLSRAISLAVAAVPEGLPFVATVAELAAARRLSARGALVRNPSTIEALGRVNKLCFDKTGTLTEGRIALRTVSDGVRVAPVSDSLPPPLREVIAVAARASPFQLDPHQVTHQTDRAVLAGAAELGLPASFGHDQLEHLAELPFESSRGYHATLWRGATALHLSIKGAPEVVLPLCTRTGDATPLDAEALTHIDAQVQHLARQGQRVLAVAEARLPTSTRTGDGPNTLTEADIHDLHFTGLIGLVDPVRPTAAAALATLRAADVEVHMITGDHPSTAKTIAAELRLVDGRGVLTGDQLDNLNDDELAEALPNTAVFARVTPAQKARIVTALRHNGAVVAVTGDGTNDAPAIRLADVGIALGSRATPAAREAADLVVTDDRIETITDAIVEGRAMWSSVRDALSILLGGNLGEIAYTLGTGLLNGAGSLNTRQLLLINLLTDVLPAMAVAVRPPPRTTPDQLLAEGPERSLSSSLNRDIALRAATTSLSAGAAWLLARPLSTAGQASTTGLVALVGAQLGQTMAVRGRTALVTAAGLGSLGLLALAVQTPGLSHLLGCRPLLPHHWGIALTAAAAATTAQLLGQRLLRPDDASRATH